MSTKFFNNIETTLMDKFHGIASAMANFDNFLFSKVLAGIPQSLQSRQNA